MPSLIRKRSVSSLVYPSGAPFHRYDSKRKFPPLPAYPDLRVLDHPGALLIPVVFVGAPYLIARITPESKTANSRKLTHLSDLHQSFHRYQYNPPCIVLALARGGGAQIP